MDTENIRLIGQLKLIVKKFSYEVVKKIKNIKIKSLAKSLLDDKVAVSASIIAKDKNKRNS